MIISLIVAVDMENGIGRDGGMPWRLSADLANFKKLTMGHYLLMGRKTYESIGKPLPGRKTIVLTRNSDPEWSTLPIVRSLDEAITLALLQGETELYVAGGGDVFTQTIDLAHRIYLTRVFTRANCDVFFPPINQKDWKLVERWFHPRDLKNDFAFEFVRLERTRL